MFRKVALVGCAIALLALGYGPARARASNSAEAPTSESARPDPGPNESGRLLLEAGLLLGMSLLIRHPASGLR